MGRPDDHLRSVTPDLQSVEEVVLERLREAIVSGQLAPGEKLRIRNLSEVLGVSTMPVRRALATLELEGFVSHEAHRSYEVIPATMEEAHTIYLIRVRLESLAAELVAAERTEQDLTLLQELLMPGDLAAEQGNFEAFRRADSALHEALNQACRRPRLIQLVEEMRRSARRYQYLYDVTHRSPEEMRQTQSEHRRLVQALAERDGQSAAEMVAAGMHRCFGGLREETGNADKVSG